VGVQLVGLGRAQSLLFLLAQRMWMRTVDVGRCITSDLESSGRGFDVAKRKKYDVLRRGKFCHFGSFPAM
jgi:hypothetical protein